MKLEADPRVTAGGNFFASTIDWMRRATRSLNPLVDAIGPIRGGALSISETLDGPAFHAYRSSDQTGLAGNAFSKVVHNAELLDSANCFDTSNGRFTPTKPGWYQINVAITSTVTAGANFSNYQTHLYKNGVSHKRFSVAFAGGATDFNTVWQDGGSTLVFLNGTTDYVEAFAYNGGPTTCKFDGEAAGASNHFSGYLAHRA